MTGQDFVTINGKLWAVDRDPNSHGDGKLITTNGWLTIDGKGIIVVGDHADPDDLCPVAPIHCDPYASSGDGMVTVS